MTSARALTLAGTLALPVLVATPASAGVPPGESPADAVVARAGPTDLRAMTWNIQHGVPNGGSSSDPADLERIANVIRTENPDVVTLNEVHDDEDFAGSHGHQPAILKTLLEGDGYAYAHYGVSETHSSDHPGTRGEMILSKFPIWNDPGDPREPESIPLSTQHANPGQPNRRSMVKVTLAVPGAGDVRVYATHLSPPASEAQVADQLDQARTILNREQGNRNVITRLTEPVLLMGDFNIRPTNSASPFSRNSTIKSWIADRGFVDTWTVKNDSADGVSRPNAYGRPDGDFPDRRIDYVFASPRFDVLGGHVSLVDRDASDHLAIVMDLRIRDSEVLESGSLVAGGTGEEGWAQLALEENDRAKLTVCKNSGTTTDDGWAVRARVYNPGRDKPYRVEYDGGTSRDRCQTATWQGYSPTDTALETCLVKGDEVKDCRKHTVFDRGRAGAIGEAGTADVRVTVDNDVRVRVCDERSDGWGVKVKVYDNDPDNPIVEGRAEEGCTESEWRPWDWGQDSLIAENCLYRDGHPDRACNTRVLASKD